MSCVILLACRGTLNGVRSISSWFWQDVFCYSGAEQLSGHHSALVEVLCCGNRGGKPPSRDATRQPHVLQRYIYGAKSSVNCSTWATAKATSIQVQRGSRTWNKFAPGEASQQSPSQKPLQPTLWECNWMIACTTMLPLMCRPLAWQKPLPLSAWAWLPSANCRLLFCSQNLVCYPWVSKCTDRSRWSLGTVTSGHGHPSILGATAIVEHQPSPAFPPGDILSLIGYLGQKWTVKGFHAAFH